MVTPIRTDDSGDAAERETELCSAFSHYNTNCKLTLYRSPDSAKAAEKRLLDGDPAYVRETGGERRVINRKAPRWQEFTYFYDAQEGSYRLGGVRTEGGVLLPPADAAPGVSIAAG